MKHTSLLTQYNQIKKFVLAAGLVGTIAGGAASTARASLTFNISEVGANVVASGTGSFDLSSLTSFFTGAGGGSGYLDAANSVVAGGSASSTDWYLCYPVSGDPLNFGSGSYVAASASNGSGYFAFNPNAFGNQALLQLPSGYVSGTSMSVSSTWDNASFASLGLTPGSYTWAWTLANGSGPSDSVTVNVGPVPEPSTWALLAFAGVGALAVSRFRKHSAPHSV